MISQLRSNIRVMVVTTISSVPIVSFLAFSTANGLEAWVIIAGAIVFYALGVYFFTRFLRNKIYVLVFVCTSGLYAAVFGKSLFTGNFYFNEATDFKLLMAFQIAMALLASENLGRKARYLSRSDINA